MHKLVLKFFNFLKSATQFVKIILLFCIMLLLIHWMEVLLQANWSWLDFIKPLLKFFITIGESINNNSVELFAAKFEYKFAIALLIFMGLYLVDHFILALINHIEEIYNNGRNYMKKVEENKFNQELERQNTQEQRKLKRYQIYVSASVKEKFRNKHFNIDINEQNKIMNKFLIDKTGICPENFEGGFLYTFDNFSEIDKTLSYFFRLIKSDAPLDYIICVQIMGNNSHKEVEQLKTLISLKLTNKITTLSDTIYRYGFNPICKYGTSQIGLFTKGNESFEAHQFNYCE